MAHYACDCWDAESKTSYVCTLNGFFWCGFHIVNSEKQIPRLPFVYFMAEWNEEKRTFSEQNRKILGSYILEPLGTSVACLERED